VHVPAGADCQTPPWARPAANSVTRPAVRANLVIADRWYPSSRTCHTCGLVHQIGWAQHWTCQQCGAIHQRDDNAAINLARYENPG
jgi:Putative transposase DNA-binding domain